MSMEDQVNRLQEQVQSMTELVGQLLQERAAPVSLPGSPPRSLVPIALPNRYEGDPDACQAFLMQCGLYVTHHPAQFRSEEDKVHFVVSLLGGQAVTWATALWAERSPLLRSSRDFQDAFRAVFVHPAVGRSLGDRLLDLRQGNCTAADFSLEFRTLAARLQWPADCLQVIYRRALRPELACRGAACFFDEYVKLSISLDTIIWEQRRSSPHAERSLAAPPARSDESEPMIVGRAPLMTEERERRLRRGLCIYCESPLPEDLSVIPEEYRRFSKVFSKKEAYGLPPHRSSDCAIDLLDGATLPQGRLYSLSRAEEAMRTYISESLEQGIIRPSTSPVAAGFFFVGKKDGGLRPCIDYRALNAITKKRREPLPLIPSTLEQLRRAWIFTKLDLHSAYNLIRICEGDEWKTSFLTSTGQYEYLVMPYGLANSPSIFQAFINDIFQDVLHRFVITYIDDILIYSDNEAQHVTHVQQVLQRLADHHLYVKGEKCEFHRSTIKFLGYLIRPGEVAMDPSKIQGIREWPQPKTIKELERFLGFANFYRRFIRGFSAVAAPLTNLLRGGTKRLAWSEDATQAFTALKERFCTAPVLQQPDPNEPFIVEVDASEVGIGAVLSQRDPRSGKFHPCAFLSKNLSPAESNYDVGNRELLAIKRALEEWRHWLEGAKHPFKVLTDHRNLQYLQSARRLNPRQARWALFSTRFNFKSSSSDVPAVDQWYRRSERVWHQAHRQLSRRAEQTKKRADRQRRTAPIYKPGYRVWHSTQHLWLPRVRKLGPKYIGPFCVIMLVGPITYRLQLPRLYRIHPVFHVSLLKPVRYSLAHAPSDAQDPPPQIPLTDGDAYAVHSLLDSRRRGRGLQYLVDWVGYGPEERCWAPASDILDPSLIAQFHAGHPSRPRP
nr:uncharacterized protein LOC111837765 [Paramormyrops kingsleyae]